MHLANFAMLKAGLFHYWAKTLLRNSKRPDASLVMYTWIGNFVLAVRFELYMICCTKRWSLTASVAIQVLSYLCATVWFCLLNFLLCDTMLPLYAHTTDDDADAETDAHVEMDLPPRVRSRLDSRRRMLVSALRVCRRLAKTLKTWERAILEAEADKERAIVEECTRGLLHRDEVSVTAEFLRHITLVATHERKFEVFFAVVYHGCAWCLLYLAFPGAYIQQVGDHIFVCAAGELMKLNLLSGIAGS